MVDNVVDGYLALGLRIGRLVEGFVDCWFGDPALRRRVDAEPAPAPADLARQATELRSALLDSALDQRRRQFLDAQLRALDCVSRKLAGEQMSFGAEVEDYFDVPVELGDPDRYAAVHDQIDELLPGPGSLRDRVEAFYERNVIPPDRLARAVSVVSGRLRDLTRAIVPLPAGERVDYEVVRDRPWNAFNQYHGGYRSTVTVNVHAGRTIAVIPHLITHESYPGHHTEHCVKEELLVTSQGQAEHTISLVNTPQCLVSEGLAEHAISAVLGHGWGGWTQRLLADEGVRLEGELVERLLGPVSDLLPVRQDAAILLHDRGADGDEVVDYLQRWLLLPHDRAAQIGRFLMDPLWRAYSVTYIEGRRLVGAWLDARGGQGSRVERYLRLLREPLLPATLRDDLAEHAAAPVNAREVP
jgi:hypothetical protein